MPSLLVILAQDTLSGLEGEIPLSWAVSIMGLLLTPMSVALVAMWRWNRFLLDVVLKVLRDNAKQDQQDALTLGKLDISISRVDERLGRVEGAQQLALTGVFPDIRGTVREIRESTGRLEQEMTAHREETRVGGRDA